MRLVVCAELRLLLSSDLRFGMTGRDADYDGSRGRFLPLV